jgi:hypothetical protein
MWDMSDLEELIAVFKKEIGKQTYNIDVSIVEFDTENNCVIVYNKDGTEIARMSEETYTSLVNK